MWSCDVTVFEEHFKNVFTVISDSELLVSINRSVMKDIEIDFLSDSLSEMSIIDRVLDGDDDFSKDILYVDGNRRVEDFLEP